MEESVLSLPHIRAMRGFNADKGRDEGATHIVPRAELSGGYALLGKMVNSPNQCARDRQ